MKFQSFYGDFDDNIVNKQSLSDFAQFAGGPNDQQNQENPAANVGGGADANANNDFIDLFNHLDV